MSVNLRQFREFIVTPTLQYLTPEIPWSLAAERLLMGTAIHESGLVYLEQLGPGPALGFWQMEPETAGDVWYSWLDFRPDVAQKIEATLAPHPARVEQLQTNLYYSCAMARVLYRRDPKPLPPAGDIHALGAYAKRVWNTWKGKATVEDYVRAIEAAVDAER